MRTFRFNSKTRPDAEPYTTIMHDDGRVTCNCTGFIVHKHCWHQRDVAAGNLNTYIEPVNTPAIPFAPMLASALKEGRSIHDFSPREWVAEEKYDGHRMIVTVHNIGGATAWSRGGKIRELMPHITKAMNWVTPGTYDGELIIPGGTSTDVVNLELLPSSRLMLFDILASHETALTGLTADKRRVHLKAAVSMMQSDAVQLAEQFDPTTEALKKVWDRGGEGLVLKRREGIYEPGKRSREWVKFKAAGSAVLTITGFEEGLNGPHSKIVALDDAGVTITVKTLNTDWLEMFTRDATRFLGRRLVITFQQKTRDGKYRHPMADHIV